MKSFYLLLSAACVAFSASAVEKELATRTAGVVESKCELQFTNPVKVSKSDAVKLEKTAALKAPRKEADDSYSYTYFRAADGIQSISYSTLGYGYGTHWGFKCVQGNFIFNNYSTNVKSNVWNYSWYENREEVDYTSTDSDLVIESKIGEMLSPTLDVTYNSGATDFYEVPADEYLVGANPAYWGLGGNESSGPFGLSFYQNTGYENNGYTGSLTNYTSYSVDAQGFNENGVYGGWQEDLEADLGVSISNLAIENFTILQPKPLSTYFITKGWLRCSMTVTANTQLISYIYPVVDNVISETPIAIGFATVTPDTLWPVFDYSPLSEDGDELDDVVYIDSEIAITIEGFNGNDAITDLTPASGYYPFDLTAYRSGNYDINMPNDTYVLLSFDIEGDSYTYLTSDPYMYYLDKANGVMSGLAHSQFATDATYAYIMTVNGEDSVELPQAGGSVDVVIDPYFSDVKGLLDEEYFLETPEWVNVEVSDFDQQTGYTTLTISAEAAAEARAGIVSLSGFGTSLDITVNQGESAVNVVKAEAGVEYYDLAGRRVVNPTKGVYVKVSGNKAEKVIL